jgi:hypothetical protein
VGEGSVKAGYGLNHRERDFDISAYVTDASKLDRKYRNTLPILPIDKIFAPENYGKDADGKQMFDFIPYTVFTGQVQRCAGSAFVLRNVRLPVQDHEPRISFRRRSPRRGFRPVGGDTQGGR